MHLRHLVPTLGLTLAAISTASAVDVGQLTIGGFVDAVSSVSSSDETRADFGSDLELQLGYKIGTNVMTQVDLEFGKGNDSGNVEQAYVAWALTDMVTLQMGRMGGPIGYQAPDAPGLWRVGKGLTSAFYGDNSIDGVNAVLKVSDELTATVYLANSVTRNSSKDMLFFADMAFGVQADYSTDMFSVGVDLAIDQSDADTVESNQMTVAAFGEYKGIEGMTIFGELAMRSYDETALGFLLGANYGLSETMSVTGMFSTISQKDLKMSGNGDQPMQIAVALLTNPTTDKNFAVNYEVQFTMLDDDAKDDETKLSVEFLTIIP